MLHARRLRRSSTSARQPRASTGVPLQRGSRVRPMGDVPFPRARTLTGMTVNLDETGVPARPSARCGPAGLRRPYCRTAKAATAARSADRGRDYRHGPDRLLRPSGLRGRAPGLAVASGVSTGSAQLATSSSGSSGSSSTSRVHPPSRRSHFAVHAASRRDGLPDPNSSGNFPPARNKSR